MSASEMRSELLSFWTGWSIGPQSTLREEEQFPAYCAVADFINQHGETVEDVEILSRKDCRTLTELATR